MKAYGAPSRGEGLPRTPRSAPALVPFLLAIGVALPLGGCVSQVAPASTPAGAVEPARAPFVGVVDIRLTHDHLLPEGTQTFEIERREVPVDVRAYFLGRGDGSVRACVGGTAHLTVKTPSGEVALQVDPAILQALAGKCGIAYEKKNTTLEEGRWTAQFTGHGAAFGHLEIRAAAP